MEVGEGPSQVVPGYWRNQVKGYHSDRVDQTFYSVTSRRNLIRAALIGIPALALASASASRDSAPAEEAAPVIADAPLGGQFEAGGRKLYGTGSDGA
jgi:hypothetical protein